MNSTARTGIKRALLFLAVVMPLFCFGAGRARNIYFTSTLIDYINFALVISSLVAIRQFFWREDYDRLLFQIIHSVIILLFYSISLSYLVSHKQYYEDYGHLSNIGCVIIFFFGMGLDSIKQWVIVFAFFINILYVIRSAKAKV